ncbi:YbjQ family protein [Confluentibacter citreus]|uniref:YbjQ family protein n=1 Tax=Confluentibacter citreus TaxID=2007307 RepID=UPI000C29195D|nr:heavy metal-binding domain-containing protein [Confluentibacter citreus]
MILTTTNSVEGFRIIEYKGIVSGVAVNVQKMKMTFKMQKYYSALGESISEIKEQALQQLKENAEKLNANAVIGIKVDIELTMYVTVSVTGTAVTTAFKKD